MSKPAVKQTYENTLFLSHSGPRLFWVAAGRNEDGSARFLRPEHRVSDEAARAEGVRLGMLFWGPNGGPIAPIDAPYPGKAFTGSIQDRHDVVTYYEDGKPFTGAKHRRSGSEWYVEGKRVA